MNKLASGLLPDLLHKDSLKDRKVLVTTVALWDWMDELVKGLFEDQDVEKFDGIGFESFSFKGYLVLLLEPSGAFLTYKAFSEDGEERNILLSINEKGEWSLWS
ncbi:MAG: hypothetical protein QXI02_04130 [Candidatus Caldarchaeum sp.]